MIQIGGPTVFPGYLLHDGLSPFVEESGKRWYLSGDLGELDADGYLRFRGRLKRFLKAGGEMISLPAWRSSSSDSTRQPATDRDRRRRGRA